MISSEEAFLIFEKWKEEATFLLLIPSTPSSTHTKRAIVLDVLKNSGKIVLLLKTRLLIGGPETDEGLDLEGATFDFADPRESPDPELASAAFDCFLRVSFPSGRQLIIAAQ